MTGLILASQSVARRRMLAAAGVRFEIQPPTIDEPAIIQSLLGEGQGGRNISDCLAELKALRVSAQAPTSWVIGSDQVLSLGDEIFEKPADVEEVRRHLLRLRGKTHLLHAAVCVARAGSVVWRHVGEARMSMRGFSDLFLEKYLKVSGADVVGSVGAYHVEGPGVQLFSHIEGDLFTVQGMPLLPLLDFLRVQGLATT
jgi:septum formation protein